MHGTHHDGARTVSPTVDEPLGAGRANQYNRYVSTKTPRGSQSSAFWGLVPYAATTADPLSLDQPHTRPAPAGNRIMCLSCHRATHRPSGRRTMGLRRDASGDSHPFRPRRRSASDVAHRYYALPLGGTDSPCHKCHPRSRGGARSCLRTEKTLLQAGKKLPRALTWRLETYYRG